MALFYADASALVKLVRDEPESDSLRAFAQVLVSLVSARPLRASNAPTTKIAVAR